MLLQKGTEVPTERGDLLFQLQSDSKRQKKLLMVKMPEINIQPSLCQDLITTIYLRSLYKQAQ
jgi:hypothetical protein